MKLTSTYILLILLCFSGFVSGQDRNYLYGGLDIECFRYNEPFKLIIDDFNNYHDANDISTAHSFALPFYMQGYSLGAKIHSRFSEFGGNVHFKSFTTIAEGNNSEGNEYYNKLATSYNGFHLFYRILIINTNYFRTGPGISFEVEQFKMKLDFSKDPSWNTMLPINKALMSGQLTYTFSIGGPKFNMDIGAFYQIPFWQIDFSNLNNKLNEGFATNYDASQMNFNPVKYGVSLCIGLGARGNYDF
jgi:hypothetical protein